MRIYMVLYFLNYRKETEDHVFLQKVKFKKAY